MGQSWWWVVLAVVVVALLVAVAVLRTRRHRGSAAAENIEVAAAAAGGTGGALAAAAVATGRAEPEPATTPDAAPAEVVEPEVVEPEVVEPEVVEPEVVEPEVVEPEAAEPEAAEPLALPEPPDDDPGVAPDPAADVEPEVGPGEAAVPRIPAPREEVGSTPPEPAGSALAALDTALFGPASPVADASAAVTAATARPGPYPGSLLPAADGSAPSPVHLIKANEGSRRYHTPDSPYYVRTRGDAWFHTAEEARAAGFTAWDERS